MDEFLIVVTFRLVFGPPSSFCSPLAGVKKENPIESTPLAFLPIMISFSFLDLFFTSGYILPFVFFLFVLQFSSRWEAKKKLVLQNHASNFWISLPSHFPWSLFLSHGTFTPYFNFLLHFPSLSRVSKSFFLGSILPYVLSFPVSLSLV